MLGKADRVSDASARAWERFMSTVPGAWTRRAGGAIATVSGVPLAGYNGVWGVSANPRASWVTMQMRA